MDFIISYFRIDFIIYVSFNNKENIIDFENIEIFPRKVFRNINFTYKKMEIDSTYFKYKDLSTKNNNNNYIGDSTNELLTAPRQILNEKNKNKEKDNRDDSIIRRINTESGYISPLNNNKLLEENDINQANIDDVKLSINKNNNNDNNINGVVKNQKNDNYENEDSKEKSEDNDIDELYNDEKFNGVRNENYNKLSLKKQIKNKEEYKYKNKEEEKNEDEKEKQKIRENEIEKENRKERENEENKIQEELKKYTFNDSQLTINLSSYEGESIKPIGLFNPSIYCFMISILQALLSIPELNYYFLSKYYKSKNKINDNENDNNKNTRICDAFHEFIKLYLLGKNHIDIPRDLKSICIRLLGGMRMHDCQEFFVCFLEALQGELNSNEKIKNPENATMKLKWIIYRRVNNSFIDSVFTGLMRSTVQCKNCDFKSLTYDPFIDLSVSINKNKNLEKCLKQYFEKEKIDSEYKCDNCKKVSKVSKLINYIIFFRQ